MAWKKNHEEKLNPDGRHYQSIQNSGYLFSNINAVEVKTVNDTIDFEIKSNGRTTSLL
jgi:outer membrane protein insertion porin family